MHNLIILTVFFFAVIYLLSNFLYAAFWMPRKARRKLEEDYRALRRRAYPPVGDQLDEIMKWLFTETEFQIPKKLKSMAAKCMSVKAQYPKPKKDL